MVDLLIGNILEIMKSFNRICLISVAAILLAACGSTSVIKNESSPSKREFRGAWIQAVNGQFVGMSTAQMQKTIM